jgi:hypothetical protein
MSNSLGISRPVMSDNALQAKVRSLEEINDRVIELYNRAFLIHRIILNPQGTELRGFVTAVQQLLCHPQKGAIAQYRALFANGSLNEQKRKVSEAQMTMIEQTLARILNNPSNDHITLVIMKMIFFSALVIEHSIFATMLPETEQQIRRFSPIDDSVLPQSAVSAGGGADEQFSINFLARRALAAFGTKYLQIEFSRLVDGANEVIESADEFVENCVNAYIAQLPAYLPLELMNPPATTSAQTSDTKK